MISRRGFTLTEMLIAVGVITIVAGLSYPVFQKARERSKMSSCSATLRQIGVALALYRESEGGNAVGTPSQMGLPPDPISLWETDYIPIELFWECKGHSPGGALYSFNFPSAHDSKVRHENWAAYSRKHGEAVVTFYDLNHQESLPRNFTWERWLAIGLRLDGSTYIRHRMGAPVAYGWWHDE